MACAAAARRRWRPLGLRRCSRRRAEAHDRTPRGPAAAVSCRARRHVHGRRPPVMDVYDPFLVNLLRIELEVGETWVELSPGDVHVPPPEPLHIVPAWNP